MQINWNKFIADKLPRPVRDPLLYAIMKALFAPLVLMYNEFLNYTNAVRYKLEHTSQVWSIEDVLNDAFDIDQRRIYITGSGGEAPVLLYPDEDQQPVILQPDEDGEPVLLNPDSMTLGSYDAVIWLPFEPTQEEMFRLRAIVDSYKLAGITYDVLTF